MYNPDLMYEGDIVKIINNKKVIVSSKSLMIYNSKTKKFIIQGSLAWNSLFELCFSTCKFSSIEEDRLWDNVDTNNISDKYSIDNMLFVDNNTIREVNINNKRKK